METITIPYTPRPMQRMLHQSLARFNVLVCHRRFGKTVFALNQMIRAAILNPRPAPHYAYIAPTRRQAKQVAWDYLKQFLRDVPGVFFYEQTLEARFNGRVLRLLGAAHADRLRGIYLDGVVLDEAADIHGDVWTKVVRPALADREGWAVFIGTPKGRNQLYDMYEMAQKTKGWYAALIPASESGVLPETELMSTRSGMPLRQYLQEFECRFDVSEAGILRPEWFPTYRVLPPVEQWVWSWDCAIKAKESADFSVGGLWALAGNGYYLCDVWRQKVNYPELKKAIVNSYHMQPAQAVLVEDKASGQQVIQDLRMQARLPIIPMMPKGDKYTRLNVVSPLFEAGKVYVPEKANWLRAFLDELTLFPSSAHDDQVDMVSQFLQWASCQRRHYDIS